MPNTHNIQTYILEQFVLNFKNQAEAVAALKKLLPLNQDGIYRRLRGEAHLTLEEIEKIATKYKIPLDAHVFRNTDNVSFQFNPFVKTIETFDDYTNELYEAVKPLSQLKGLTLQCATSELPLFYFLSSPALFAFRMFVFARSVWNFEGMKTAKFSINLVSPTTQAKATAIWDMYKMQNTIEMWDINILNSTITQIEHYAQTAVFKNKKDALAVCYALFELVTNIENMAAQGKKSSGEIVPENSFTLYDNEIFQANTTILINSESHKIMYTHFISPDFMRTTDSRVIEYTQNWFDDIISKSVQISEQGEKNRKRFFKFLLSKIEDLTLRIEKHVETATRSARV